MGISLDYTAKVNLYAICRQNSVLPFIDDEGGIIVPKDVRPTIDYEETHLGNKKGAKRQFRYKNLHIREYSGYYTVHIDRVDPRKDLFGHLLIDAPEFLVGIISAISIGKLIGSVVDDSKRVEDDNKESNCLME
jgi:hypothetical protein